MVTNEKLAMKVEEKEELLQKENREMKGILEKLASKLEHMKNVVEKKEMKEVEEEEEVPDDDEDEVPKNGKPFFKDLNALGGKPITLLMFIGKMDVRRFQYHRKSSWLSLE